MNDPIAILKKDHREVSAMLKQLADSKPSATRRKTTDKVVAALTLHMAIEEELVYPIVDKRIGHEDEQEAETEHTLARDGLTKMVELVAEPGFGAAVAMVTAGIKHHVKEEETELFPELKRKLDRTEARVTRRCGRCQEEGEGAVTMKWLRSLPQRRRATPAAPAASVDLAVGESAPNIPVPDADAAT